MIGVSHLTPARLAWEARARSRSRVEHNPNHLHYPPPPPPHMTFVKNLPYKAAKEVNWHHQPPLRHLLYGNDITTAGRARHLQVHGLGGAPTTALVNGRDALFCLVGR